MEKIVITGNGPLRGEVRVAGAKNAALPIIAASLLSAEPLQVSNIPGVRDIDTALKLLTLLGCQVERSGTDLAIDTSKVHSVYAPYELVKTMRGAHFTFDIPSVTATENLLMAASLADGPTVLENCAMEPEVGDLARLLIAMGARIDGMGSSTLTIAGVERLSGASHRVPPDRIETGTFLTAAAATRGSIRVLDTNPDFLHHVLGKLEQAGANIVLGPDWIHLDTGGKLCQAVHINTAPYPAFPTDMQAQFMALNALAEGSATVVENIFENRFMHVAELQRMGADIELQGHTAIVRGRERLQGAPVMATDLRASASLIIAALAAEGDTIIDRVYHLDRGYANIDLKLAGLGAIIKRV